VVYLGLTSIRSLCISQDTVTITIRKEGCNFEYLHSRGIHMMPLHQLSHCFWFEAVQPCFISWLLQLQTTPKALKECSCISSCVNLSVAVGPIWHTPLSSPTVPVFCKHLLSHTSVRVTVVSQLCTYLL
jgi:hypothetical protein